MGQFNKAAAHLDTAIAYYIKSEGENSSSLDFPYMNLGNVYYELDDYARAMQYQFKSLDIHKQKINNQEDSHTGKCYLNIGNAFSGMNKPEQALEYYFMAMTTFDTTLSQRDLLFAYVENNIGFCYQLKGDYSAAIKYAKSSLNRYAERGFGAHPSLIHSRIALGSNYWKAEMFDSAAVVFQSIVEVFEPVLGSQHQAVLEAKYYLLRNLVRQNQPAAAIEFYQKSGLDIENTELPDKQITEYTRIKNEYAKALYMAYRQQNQTELLEKSIDVLQSAIDQLDEQQEFFSKENRGDNLSFRTDLTEEMMNILIQRP
jgi:tetratricopeptide (TPR) repeat protein